jgi:hypothetical protein
MDTCYAPLSEADLFSDIDTATRSPKSTKEEDVVFAEIRRVSPVCAVTTSHEHIDPISSVGHRGSYRRDDRRRALAPGPIAVLTVAIIVLVCLAIIEALSRNASSRPDTVAR